MIQHEWMDEDSNIATLSKSLMILEASNSENLEIGFGRNPMFIKIHTFEYWKSSRLVSPNDRTRREYFDI